MNSDAYNEPELQKCKYCGMNQYGFKSKEYGPDKIIEMLSQKIDILKDKFNNVTLS